MITALRLTDFKNFADEMLHVGRFTVIVGANASGKSNIRDALRFLHGVGRGYTLAEIAGGKYGADWKPIRGATNELVRFGASGSTSEVDRFGLEVEMVLALSPLNPFVSKDNARYRIGVHPEMLNGGRLSLADEALWINSEEVYSARVLEDENEQLDRAQPGLHRIPHDSSRPEILKRVGDVIRQFDWMRFFDFKLDRMREPAFPGHTSLGDSGEYLPIVLQDVCADPKRKSILASWLRALTPMDVEDFEFPADPSGRVHLVICEANGARVSAESASDGTLRFLAMLAALLGRDPSYVYFFEEIENGLHPSRLHLLIDLIERVTADGARQVIATTHSPELLSMVRDPTFESTSVVCRMEDANEALIRRIADLPNARELRKTQGLGRLLAGGWMETALAFTEGNEERSE